MGVTLVGRAPEEHGCELPKQGLFPNVFPWTRNPLCVGGNIIQCDVCGKRYVYEYWGYSETWNWVECD